MIFGQPVFWRETMKPARFLIFDGRVVLVLVPTFMHLRIWTILLAMTTMMTFWWFDRKGISANSILRFVRSRFIGKRRTARGPHEERTAVDFACEMDAWHRARSLGNEAGGQAARRGILVRLGLMPSPQGAAPANGPLSLSKGEGE